MRKVIILLQGSGDLRILTGVVSQFAFLFLFARLDLLPICILHPVSTLLLCSFSNGKPSVVDSYFQPFYGFRRPLIREFLLISPASVRDQAFQASSLIVHSLYKLYKFLGSSIVEFSTRLSSPLLQSKAPSSDTAG